MPDPYRDAALVELYDLDNPGGDDHSYYRALADEIEARSIVDLGCGTGLLTRSLATPGRTVIGVDPSPTMVDFARRQPGAGAVTWIQGDASAIAPTGTADLVICTGNAMMHISPEELPAACTSIAAAHYTGPSRSKGYRWFTDPATRELHVPEDHQFLSRMYVAGLRGIMAMRGPGSRAAELTDLLLEHSDEFRTLWEIHEVGVHPDEVKRYQHPQVGRLELNCQTLLDPHQSHRLMVYTAVPGTESYDKLQMLSVIGAQTLV